MNEHNLQIRPIRGLDDIFQLEHIQIAVWGMADDDVIPARMFHALETNGACLLGAYDGEKMVGFVLGVLGTMEGLDERIDQIAAARLLMYSVTMGILPEYQRMGLGYRLKIAQREFALRIGIRLITWTYDPLESLNAYLNIRKLGVVCHRYLLNYYGPMSGINEGLPTDRFYVEWWVTSNRVTSRVNNERGPLSLKQYLEGNAVMINECRREARGLLVPAEEFQRTSTSMVIVAIPENFQRIKVEDRGLALDWRLHSREIFTHYFQEGYLVTDFLREKEESGEYRSYYLLTQGSG